MSEQLAERHAVKNPISRYTILSGHRDAPTNQIDFRGGMSIGVDAHQAAKLKRTLTPGLGIWGGALRACLTLPTLRYSGGRVGCLGARFDRDQSGILHAVPLALRIPEPCRRRKAGRGHVKSGSSDRRGALREGPRRSGAPR